MERNKTRIRRSWGFTLGLGAGGLALLAVALWMMGPMFNAPRGEYGGAGGLLLGIGGGIAGIVAVVLLFAAWSSSCFAPCPACSARVDDLSGGENAGALCDGCKKFLEGAGGDLWVTDDDTIASEPTFGAALPAEVDWPDGCCVCGAPATRALPSTAAERTLAVPHCAAHDQGAKLCASSPATIKILFRSYPFQRAFCRKNRVDPRRR